MRRVGVSFLLLLVAVIVFVLATFDVTLGSLDVANEISLGLAFFAASFLAAEV